jgi:hypothetical protein
MKERCRYGGPSLLPVLGWAQFHVITALGVSFTAAAADRLLWCSALLLPSCSLGSILDLRTSASLRTFRLLQAVSGAVAPGRVMPRPRCCICHCPFMHLQLITIFDIRYFEIHVSGLLFGFCMATKCRCNGLRF